jgi:hypothetical protein
MELRSLRPLGTTFIGPELSAILAALRLGQILITSSVDAIR